MRIAHICLDYPPRRTKYGSGTVADDLLAELGRQGHELRILTPGRSERVTSAQSDPHIIEAPVALSNCYLLPSDRPTEMFASPEDVMAWNQAAQTWFHQCAPLGAWNPDIIYNDGWTTQPLATALSARYRCPVVTTAHVVDRHYAAVRTLPDRPSEPVFRAAEQACFDESHIIIMPSHTALELAAFYYPQHRDKLRTVAHGLNWAAIDDALTLPPTQPKTPEDDTIVVHYLGRISSERGWEPFLSAFLAAAEQDKRLRLRVTGDGRLAEAREKFSHPAIHFTGAMPRSQVLQHLKHADIFCNPALMETFGVAELEALGLGLCIVSNSGFGKHTHVDHLTTGIRIPLLSGPRPQLDQRAWTHWLLKLADDAQLRQQLADAGRRSARQRFDITTMAANLRTTFEAAIAPAQVRPSDTDPPTIQCTLG